MYFSWDSCRYRSLYTLHLTEVAKTIHENVISVGATITAIAESLGHSGKFHTLKPHFWGIPQHCPLAYMSILDNRDGTIKYPHHKQILFTFPTVARTTIVNKKNWNCDWVVIRERVLPPSSVLPPPPFTQSQPSTSFDMGGSSSTPHMAYDATFLQSFANLHMDVADLRRGTLRCNRISTI